MITLTGNEGVRQVLGDPSILQSYTKVVLDQITYSPLSRSITAVVRLSVAADETIPVLFGQVTIDVNGGTLTLTFAEFRITRKVTLLQAWKDALNSYIDTAQQQIEEGIIVAGAVAGAFSSGV